MKLTKEARNMIDLYNTVIKTNEQRELFWKIMEIIEDKPELCQYVINYKGKPEDLPEALAQIC